MISGAIKSTRHRQIQEIQAMPTMTFPFGGPPWGWYILCNKRPKWSCKVDSIISPGPDCSSTSTHKNYPRHTHITCFSCFTARDNKLQLLEWPPIFKQQLDIFLSWQRCLGNVLRVMLRATDHHFGYFEYFGLDILFPLFTAMSLQCIAGNGESDWPPLSQVCCLSDRTNMRDKHAQHRETEVWGKGWDYAIIIHQINK